MEIYDPDRIRGVISLLVPELSNITLVSSSLPESSVPLVEPHYGCRYNVSRIEASLLARCSDRVKGVIAPPPELKLPHPNRFIATDFSLLPSPPQDGSKNPESLVQDRFCQVWYQQDDEFKVGLDLLLLSSFQRGMEIAPALFSDDFGSELARVCFSGHFGVHSTACANHFRGDLSHVLRGWVGELAFCSRSNRCWLEAVVLGSFTQAAQVDEPRVGGVGTLVCEAAV